jgi:hypothetical protein
MGMAVADCGMRMRMAVFAEDDRLMHMRVVAVVMAVPVFVFGRQMRMAVGVILGGDKPRSRQHHRKRYPERKREAFPE